VAEPGHRSRHPGVLPSDRAGVRLGACEGPQHLPPERCRQQHRAGRPEPADGRLHAAAHDRHLHRRAGLGAAVEWGCVLDVLV
ncbi:MAG: Fatty acid hydroxylase family (carotene hydroxylase/sterol desaturase), partial [uncultured Ramlibacter sp.]